MNSKRAIILSAVFITTILYYKSFAQDLYHEIHRPQFHFSPQKNWVNDPNGMVYHKGVYHLFFQYFPNGTVWGPMHWGHATSKDMIHWQQQPIALYPDSLGYIFSGSAVVDKNNTSGFGKNGQSPLIAIFTHHDPVGEKEKRNNIENQSLAYSLDDGKTWLKYNGNPVLKNPGITDFRDPKVMWYEPQKKWIMTLATKDRITFYSSPNLKAWTKESEYGKELGAHGGVWECPDLFYLNDNGKKVWVLIVNINPGGPNGGSATQYFTGDFDGKVFTPYDTLTRWIDYGPDEYAGITWSNTGERKIFLGWMSNWQYANVVPTKSWRSAMTIPRELSIKHAGNEQLIVSTPVSELNSIQSVPLSFQNIQVAESFNLTKRTGNLTATSRINLNLEKLNDFSVVLSNDIGEKLTVGFDKKNNRLYIDRTRSGKVDFEKNFAGKHSVPRFLKMDQMNLTLFIDVSSIELFADNGLSVMTEIFFPNKPYNHIDIESPDGILIKKLDYIALKSIWH
jgi:fructan beta-fructosidase